MAKIHNPRATLLRSHVRTPSAVHKQGAVHFLACERQLVARKSSAGASHSRLHVSLIPPSAVHKQRAVRFLACERWLVARKSSAGASHSRLHVSLVKSQLFFAQTLKTRTANTASPANTTKYQSNEMICMFNAIAPSRSFNSFQTLTCPCPTNANPTSASTHG